MRIGLLPLLLINCLTVVIYANPTRGQEILNKKVDLVAQQKEVKVILNEISKTTGEKFVYSAKKAPTPTKVSLSAINQRLAEVLDKLLTPLDIFYHVSGDQVVLMRKGDDDNTQYFFDPETEKKTLDEASVAKLITGKVT